MARRGSRGKRGGRPATAGAALKQMIEAIAERVLERVRREIPDRESLRRIERQMRRLNRRIEAGGKRVGIRRVGRPRSDRRCTVRGCGRRHVAHGLCSLHYQARRRGKLRASPRAKRASSS